MSLCRVAPGRRTHAHRLLCKGGKIPITATVKEDAADQPFKLEGLTGKNIFVSLAIAMIAQ